MISQTCVQKMEQDILFSNSENKAYGIELQYHLVICTSKIIYDLFFLIFTSILLDSQIIGERSVFNFSHRFTSKEIGIIAFSLLTQYYK
jgi:hypothetical protein